MKKRLLYLSAVMCCVIMFLTWYAYNRDKNAKVVTFAIPVASEDSVTPEKGMAYITGEVKTPGSYSLPDDCRLQQLIAIAGGATDEADLDAVNLSEKIADGQHIIIPKKSSSQETQTPEGTGSLININTATESELKQLPGIGDALAREIVSYREKNGFFTSIDELLNVYNIGEKTLEKIRDKVTIR